MGVTSVAAPLVGVAVARISRSGLGGLKELRTLWDTIHHTEHKSPFLREVSISLRSADDRKTLTDSHGDFDYEGPGQRLLLGSQAVSACTEARPLIDRASSNDARAYRDWVMEVATRVASAARERPGNPINKTEAKLIEKVRVAIGA